MKKLGFGLLAFGIIGMILICVISTKLYGRVYMFDGYAITSALWILCFAFVGLGIFILMIPLYEKHPKLGCALALLILLGFIVAIFTMCGDINKSCAGTNDGTCTACGGDGIFFDKICSKCGGWGKN